LGVQVFCEEYYPTIGGWRFFAKPLAWTCTPQKHGITFATGTRTAGRKG